MNDWQKLAPVFRRLVPKNRPLPGDLIEIAPGVYRRILPRTNKPPRILQELANIKRIRDTIKGFCDDFEIDS